MTIRVHGAVGADRLGYFMGENALVTIVVKSADVDFAETGVLAPLDQFKYLYAKDVTKDISAMVDIDGTGPKTDTVINIGVEQRTFKGVELTNDAAYKAAYAKQHNLRQLIDTVQQRAVILGVSPAGRIATGTVDIASGYDKPIVMGADTSAVSVFIERADVMDKYPINQYGQLSGSVVPGGELIDGISKLVFMKPDTTPATVLPAAFAVKVSRKIPQVL